MKHSRLLLAVVGLAILSAAPAAYALDDVQKCAKTAASLGTKCLIKGNKILKEQVEPAEGQLDLLTFPNAAKVNKSCTYIDARALGFRDHLDVTDQINDGCNLFVYELNSFVYTAAQGGLNEDQIACRLQMHKWTSKVAKVTTVSWGKKCSLAERLGKVCDRGKRDDKVAKFRSKGEAALGKKCGADFDAVNTFEGATLEDRIATLIDLAVIRGRHWVQRVAPPNSVEPTGELGPFKVGLKTFELEDVSRLNVAGDGPRPVVTEVFLQEYKGTVIAVTHDRYFLDNVAGWILELDRGEGIPWKGNYSSWLEQKQNRLAKEEKTESKRQKTLQRELEWVRMSPKGRQSKAKARLGAYEKLLGQEAREKESKLELYIPAGERLGSKVIEAHGVSKAFGDKLLYENLDFSLPQGGIVGIVGPNGAGKTTLFNMITGRETADAGEFQVGPTVDIAYVDQEHDNLDPNKSVWEVISEGNELIKLGGKEINSRAYVSRFNFGGSDQNKKVGQLSGGERNRVHLALTLKQGANLLLLDEPTNDLDINTLRALEEGLDNFGGCAVIISHDRWFLDRVCTHILAFEGDSQVFWFEGSFSDYEENKKKRLGDVGPTRIKYKKMG